MNRGNRGGIVIRGLIAVVGVIVLAVMVLFFARDNSRIFNWSKSGFVLSSIQRADKSTISFFGVESGDFITPVHPLRGDTLLLLGDSTATFDRWIQLLESPHLPGKIVPLTFRHESHELSTLIKTRPVQRAHFFAVVLLQLLRQVIFLSFLILGFWLFLKRSQAPSASILILYCFSVAASMGRIYLPMFPQMASFQIPYETQIQYSLALYAALFSSFWLLLNLVFPHPSALYQHRPWRAYALCFAPQLIFLVLTLIPHLDGPVLGRVYYFITVTQVLSGLFVLRYNHHHAASNLEKRQTKIVFWGSGAPLVLFLIFQLEGVGLFPFLRTMDLFTRLMINNFFFLLLLATPLSILYAFRRYRLLEVEARLRRGTIYLGATIMMLAALFGVVYLIGVFLLDNIGVTSRTPTMLIALFLALGFAPARKQLQDYLESSFFPERRRLRRMSSDFLNSASLSTDSQSLCRQLSAALQDSLSIREVHTVLRHKSQGAFTMCGGDSVPVEDEGEMMICLREEGHPLFIDEAMATSRISFTGAEGQWLDRNHIALVLPLKTHEQVHGFLALGYKTDEEDYHPEEIQILVALSGQVALTLENLRLLEENIDKRRMEEELQIARKVQLRFLPQTLPPTPGLEVAASSIFSLEVAGDYYDVIPRNDGSTMLAVGDVSGKGAGAALIMANLQAALRALCEVNRPLPDIMARINHLINQSTDVEQFITFFAAVYNPQVHTLTYVNAGHNPPLLVTAAGAVRLLQAGGLILGFHADAEYDQEIVQLSSGDLLLIYTDGLSETVDAAGQEFGEDRIRRITLSNRNQPPPQILAQLNREAEVFRDGKLPHDDMTLMIAKIT
jgi:phosphoserine phosphatase RsbU/P